MERITLCIRTRKTSGTIRLRFRLIDGRKVQLYHKSQIMADLDDLKKFGRDGSLRSRVRKFNEQLLSDISNELCAMHKAYRMMKKDCKESQFHSKTFEEKVNAILYHTQDAVAAKETETLYSRFVRFVNSQKQHGIVGSSRIVTYRTVADKLFRYLTIFNKLQYVPADFNTEDILEFRGFIINECQYVGEYPELYRNLDGRSLPTKPLNQNSATLKLRALSAFFNELENCDEIQKSPFRRLSKTRRQESLREQYDEPFALSAEEFMTVMNTNVPEDLREVKEVFLLHCSLGCRIGDFMRLDMGNVAVTEDGIPYLHYIARKTAKTATGRKEKTTPIMLFAIDIIRRRKFRFDVFSRCEAKGRIIYNEKIKQLLRHCKINRPISRYNEATQKMEGIPLYQLATSKLCRKTHIDIASKIQINMYATGLHEVGSAAVEHYSKLQIPDLFRLLCLSFDQPQYQVDKDLNIIRQ